MNQSLLIAAFALAFSCAASAQVSTGQAGTMGSSGAVSNYGAAAAPTFGAGSQMNNDVRTQGGVQPNLTATLPDAKKEVKPEAPKVEPKPATDDKAERKPN